MFATSRFGQMAERNIAVDKKQKKVTVTINVLRKEKILLTKTNGTLCVQSINKSKLNKDKAISVYARHPEDNWKQNDWKENKLWQLEKKNVEDKFILKYGITGSPFSHFSHSEITYASRPAFRYSIWHRSQASDLSKRADELFTKFSNILRQQAAWHYNKWVPNTDGSCLLCTKSAIQQENSK